MIKAKIKKITILIFRIDAEAVLRELLTLGCVHPFSLEDLLEDAELAAITEAETLDIAQYQANQEALAAFGTERTLLIRGWIPEKSEATVLSKLSEYSCAWEISELPPEEADKAPVKLRWPGVFGKLQLGSAKPFTPLSCG